MQIFYDRVANLPKIADYLKSPRRWPTITLGVAKYGHTKETS